MQPDIKLRQQKAKLLLALHMTGVAILGGQAPQTNKLKDPGFGIILGRLCKDGYGTAHSRAEISKKMVSVSTGLMTSMELIGRLKMRETELCAK